VKAWLRELKAWRWTQICHKKILLKCNKWDRIQDHQDKAHLPDIHNIEVHLNIQDKDSHRECHHQAVQECKVCIFFKSNKMNSKTKNINKFNYRQTRYSPIGRTIRRTTIRRKSRRTLRKSRKRRSTNRQSFWRK
jgi:hypothetical protein